MSGELAAGDRYTHTLEPGMHFKLEPIRGGWQVRIRDDRGLDLSAMTPPRRGPNPRDILGWHFRDADNRGPNDGSVNAPQRLRLFEFEPGWKGTAGLKSAPEHPAVPGAGRGWLFIEDLGLDAFATAQAGERATAVWLRFSACLNWPVAPQNLTAPGLDESTPAFSDAERELLYGCGLPATWAPGTWLLPSWLGGDFDDDGALDYAAPVEREDGALALAICLAGTWIQLLRPGDTLLENDTSIDQIERWRVEETPRGTPDEIRLIRVEKSEHAVWAVDRQLRARTLYRGVTEEP